MTCGDLIDLQVNGYAGVDFNSDDLTEEQFLEACRRLHSDGVKRFLPTLITDRLETLAARAQKLARFIERNRDVTRVVAGIHLEGPFISPQPGYVGAHPAGAVRTATVDEALRLVDACDGHAKLVTLAPEHDDGCKTIRALVDRGVRVSAGHCNPTLDQLDQAIDAGLSMFTHLGNGCPLSLPRHDNIIQRVLSCSQRLWVCFIADGVHVPFFALQNYLDAAGLDRAIVVSDAISAAGGGVGEHWLAGQRVHVDADYATWSEDRSHLVGSALSLPQAYTNLRNRLGLSDEEAIRLTRLNPAAAIGEGL
ncbi:N-acetylglucosamine-6-phosphate deacetylase [Botrimarina colliarenosi]|uniref:N-acetylglucosamine-6-phosphate deacetylase n=1 Tax=Botrimarina colliarenosi TaxID=2528001 RepID=A0A5C5ZZA4_9BACT|nr:N-acetylglucosamine-6-phosphate deacetylase [Botrimarina colliarenosi]TWT92455.1 N-acetylglucosamine-6-phosphate deacetylase [Botrimarina colliarenosi]